jgi:hypothetical protein
MVTKVGVKIAQITCGHDVLDVMVDDKYARCFMNGISVMASKDLNIFAPVVGMVAISSSRIPNALIMVEAGESYSDFLKGILDTVSKSDQVKVKVLKEKPDEIADQKPKQAFLSKGILEDFKNVISRANECLFDVLSLSNILMKTKLPRNVLSFKDLNGTLNRVKMAVNNLLENKDQCELMIERTGTNVGRVLIAMENNLNNYKIKKSVQESVDHITADFLAFKKVLATLILSQYPLYDINPIFKKYTDYPATWFFDPSVFYNFSERYKDASDTLVNVVRAEASVIRPLCNEFMAVK